MSLPQSNARLVAVTSATAARGDRDDWDQAAGVEPAGAGTSKWTGDVPAYYRQDVQRVLGGDANVTRVRTLYVESAVARAAGLDNDDVVTFVDDAGVTRTATARVVSVRTLASIPLGLQTTRLDLDS